MNGIDMMGLLNNPTDTRNRINDFAQNNLNGIDPEQKVRELINSGQMSQQQYNMLSQMARVIMKQM